MDTEDNHKQQKDDKQVWYLPRAIIFDEVQNRHLILIASGIICLILFLLIVWSSLITIKESTIAFGEVAPVSKVGVLQHLEGGIVGKIYVSDGQQVKKGQLLLEMKDEIAQAELRQLDARRISLITDISRLRAFVKDEGLNIDELKKLDDLLEQSAISTDSITLEHMLRDEKHLLELESKSRSDQRKVIEAQISQRLAEINKLKQQFEIQQKSQKIMQQELSMYEQLIDKNYVSKKEYYAKQREFNRIVSEKVRITQDIKKAEQALQESEHQLTELDSKLQKEAITDLGKLSTELYQVQYSIRKAKDRVERSRIYAPVDGVVKGLDSTVGGVIPPGGTLLNVVPDHATMQVEARIPTDKVGNLKIGDQVKVKILTYDFARYGSIDGELKQISANTFLDKEGEPYYRAIIHLDAQYVGSKNRALRPGMSAQADIITGEKTLLQYLLKPIHTTVATAFREK